MGLPEVNVLLYASQGPLPNPAVARRWLEAVSGSGIPVGLIRMSHFSAVGAHPRTRHAALLGALLPVGAAGNLTTDAHLAAIAIEHGAILASFDCDFARFAGLRFEHLHA